MKGRLIGQYLQKRERERMKVGWMWRNLETLPMFAFSSCSWNLPNVGTNLITGSITRHLTSEETEKIRDKKEGKWGKHSWKDGSNSITCYTSFMPHYTRTDYSLQQSKRDNERLETSLQERRELPQSCSLGDASLHAESSCWNQVFPVAWHPSNLPPSVHSSNLVSHLAMARRSS